MSRIGKKEITLPKDVVLTLEGNKISVKGKKGTLTRDLHKTMKIVKEDNIVRVEPANAAEPSSNFHGLTRSLVQNMIIGVSEGFKKSLILRGVGYRAAKQGNDLQLILGYSNPINYIVPKGIVVEIDKASKEPLVHVEGCDKELVGQVAAEIRSLRKPEPYHGKGVRYHDEFVATKVGKSAKK